MPTARWCLSASVVNGNIYAIGGIDNPKKVEEYDPATDTWRQKADMPSTRVFIASSAVDGKIYVIGGETHWQGGTKLATVEEYDPATDTWTQKADMPTPRNALGTSVVNGRIYAIGGGSTTISVKKVEEYDPTTDTWTEKADMPTGMKQGSSTSVVNGKIYAFGGGPFNAPAGSVVQEYDPVTDTWTKKADMPAPRAGFSTTAVNGKIYVFGGTSTHGGAPLSTLFQYDPATDTWTIEEDMPVRNLGMSTSTVAGKIYVIGGTSVPYPYNPPLSTVWEYDPGLRVSPPDLNGDGIVDIKDLLRLIQSWHQDDPAVDVAPLPFGDGVVDVRDLECLMSFWEQGVDDPTLIGHWAFDEAEGIIAHDSAGDNDGTVMGTSAWQPAGGAVAGALECDGTTFVVTDVILNPSSGPFSIFIWIKGGASGQVIISQQAGANWLSSDPATGALMTELTSAGRIGKALYSDAIIADGNWHRIGFTWNGSTRYLYVDNILVAEDTQLGLADGYGGLTIGTSRNMAPDTFWTGLIDDVRIYNRVIRP
jgi:N-acetylneuraminic acid mutarotase